MTEKRMRKHKDLICKCSHQFSKHEFYSFYNIICLDCLSDPNVDIRLICKNFRLDNLKYLEQEYEKKFNISSR